MDEIEIKKFTFWGYLKDEPLIFYPILAIFTASITIIVFDPAPLVEVGLRMITYIAFGFQWIGFARGHEKRKIERLKLDQDLLKSYMELAILTGESKIRFLVLRQEKFISRIWNKLRRKTTLSLYERIDSDFLSFTKFYATKKEIFEMKLKGYISTDDVELAKKGIQCLSKGKKLEIQL